MELPPRATIVLWLIGIVVMLFALAMRFDNKHKVATTMWPDPRAVRWETVPVGGFNMVRPDGTQVSLPPGSMLSLPHPARVGEADSSSTFS